MLNHSFSFGCSYAYPIPTPTWSCPPALCRKAFEMGVGNGFKNSGAWQMVVARIATYPNSYPRSGLRPLRATSYTEAAR